MCVVSMIIDDWQKRIPVPEPWKKGQDIWPPFLPEPRPPFLPAPNFPMPEISKEEFEALKKELKKLLISTKIYDKATGQPNCEMKDKVQNVKRIAKAKALDFEEIFEE